MTLYWMCFLGMAILNNADYLKNETLVDVQ